MNSIKKLYLILLGLILLVLSGCVTVPNTEVCTVAGVLSAGADCAMTLSSDTRQMTMDEFLEFLLPNDKRGGAMCQSVEDWNKQKTALEQACDKLGKACSYDIREAINKVTKNIDKLQQKKGGVMAKIFSIPMIGQSNPDVKIIQEQLTLKGYKVSMDGVFGPKTKAAISKLQKDNGLEGSGIIGPKTLILLDIQIVSMNGASLTKDVQGKRQRFLHPGLRALLEAKVFPDKKIPQCFIDKNIPQCVITVAKALESLHIREEGGNNRGQMVGMIQGIIGAYSPSGTGDAWCMSTDQCIVAFIEDFFQVESPILDSEHCVTVFNAAKKFNGLIAPKCEEGTLWIAKHGDTSNGHTGIVIAEKFAGRMDTFEGNTGDSSMRDGDGAYFRSRYQGKNGDLKTLGFVRVYPDNKVV